MALKRADILARRPKIISVELTDGETVFVREVMAADWQRLKRLDPLLTEVGVQVAMVLCDEDGTRLFDPENPEDVKVCGESIGVTDADRMLKPAVAQLNAGKLKEDAAKNSDASPNIDSASA